jgi:hypothetical protein
VRVLDPSASDGSSAKFIELYSQEKHEMSAFDVTADGKSGFVGDNEGRILPLDFSAGKR